MKKGFARMIVPTLVLALALTGCSQKAPEATIGIPTESQSMASSAQESASQTAPTPAPEPSSESPSQAPSTEEAAPSATEPETPAPETPAPETPAPETPAPETPAPQTPAPETPAPTVPTETPAPETPAPTEPSETPAPETPAPTEPIVFTDTADVVWTTANVNLRTAPGTDSEVITVLRARTQLSRSGIGEGWSRVDYNGQTAFVSSDYVSTEEPPATGGHIIAIDPGHQDHGNYEQEAIGPGSAETKAKVTTGTQGVATGVPEYIVVL